MKTISEKHLVYIIAFILALTILALQAYTIGYMVGKDKALQERRIELEHGK